ncbi:MAG TPA: hypothetical protein VFL82_13035 [Thermomicrobiales bacterium]|nr:hypothetical protein [Thermomicrobiales bacterium]
MDPIARQRAVNRHGPFPRLVQLVCVALLLLALMAGCASGTARDAERAETKEATRPEVVPELQATTIVKRFFPATATPAPTSTPVVLLDTLAVSTSVGSDGQAQNPSDSLPRSGTVYVSAHLHQLTKGEHVVAVWGTVDGNELGRSDTTIDSDSNDRWIALPWNINGGVGPGQYAVFLYVDDVLLNSLVFQLY